MLPEKARFGSVTITVAPVCPDYNRYSDHCMYRKTMRKYRRGRGKVRLAAQQKRRPKTSDAFFY
jgi:hypothetical protein